jgi:hypothetical protein
LASPMPVPSTSRSRASQNSCLRSSLRIWAIARFLRHLLNRATIDCFATLAMTYGAIPICPAQLPTCPHRNRRWGVP